MGNNSENVLRNFGGVRGGLFTVQCHSDPKHWGRCVCVFILGPLLVLITTVSSVSVVCTFPVPRGPFSQERQFSVQLETILQCKLWINTGLCNFDDDHDFSVRQHWPSLPLWFRLNQNYSSLAEKKARLLQKGIPLWGRLILLLVFYAGLLIQIRSKGCGLILVYICDKKKNCIKDYLLFVVIFNYREIYSTWHCNI